MTDRLDDRRVSATAQPDSVDIRPWWREPMVWLVIGGPAIVVVAGLTTVYIAMSAPDPVIDRDYYRRGLELSQTPDSPAMRPAREARNHAATPGGGLNKPEN